MGIYKVLTDYLPSIETDEFKEWAIENEDFNGWIVDRENEDTHAMYSCIVSRFREDVYAFMDNHPEHELNHYEGILEANNLVWGTESMQGADVSALDGKCVMALLMGADRAGRYCEGALLSFFRSGAIAKWLSRLKEIDG